VAGKTRILIKRECEDTRPARNIELIFDISNDKLSSFIRKIK